MKLHVQLLALATVALTMRPSLQQADAPKECFATTTPKPGDPAEVTCMYPSDVSKVRPVSLKLEFYPWNWNNKDKVNVVDCSWATDTDTHCETQDGYTIMGGVGTQLRIQITAMSNRTEGAYVCQRLSPHFSDTFLQTCNLKFPESVPPPTGTTTAASTSQGTGGGEDDSGSSNIGLIAGVAGGVGGGVALLVAVIVGVICYRRRQKHAAEPKEPESESDFVAGPTEEPKPSVCSGFLQCCKRGLKSSNPATDEAGQIYSEINETAEDPLLGTRSGSTSDEKPPLPKPRQNSIDTVKYTKPTTTAKNGRPSSKPVAVVAGVEWPPAKPAPEKPARINSESSDPDLKSGPGTKAADPKKEGRVSEKATTAKKEDLEELMEGLKPSHLRKSSKSQAAEGESKQAPARAFSASSQKEPPAALAKVGSVKASAEKEAPATAAAAGLAKAGSVKASAEKEAPATAAATGLAKTGSVKIQGPTGPKDEEYQSMDSILEKNQEKVKEIKAKHGINPKEEAYESLASVAARSEAKANEIKEKHGINPTDENYESTASILAKNEKKVKEIEAKKQAGGRTLSSSSNKGSHPEEMKSEDGVFHTAAPVSDAAGLEQQLSTLKGKLKTTGRLPSEEQNQ